MKPQNGSAASPEWADCWVDASRDFSHARCLLSGGFAEWAALSACRGAERALTSVLLGLGLEVDCRGPVALMHKLRSEIEVPEELPPAAVELARYRMTTSCIGEEADETPTDPPPDAMALLRTDAEVAVALAGRIEEFCREHLPR